MTINVRWMIRPDLPQVIAIERDTFGAWQEDDFLRYLRFGDIIGLVADQGEQVKHPERPSVLGFMVYQIYPDTLEVLNLAAAVPEARKALIANLRNKAYQKNRQVQWPAGSIMEDDE